MAADRNAKVTWSGSLLDGSGRIEGVGSGSFGPLDVTWASCLSMALSHALAGAGTPPERLETSVTVTFQPGEGLVKGAIEVVGTVPGLDHDGFVAQAEGAKVNCPVSKALTGIPTVTLQATLAAA